MREISKGAHRIASHINDILNQCVLLSLCKETNSYAEALRSIAYLWAEEVSQRFEMMQKLGDAGENSNPNKLELYQSLAHPLHNIIEALKADQSAAHNLPPSLISTLDAVYDGIVFYIDHNAEILHEFRSRPDSSFVYIASFLDALEHEGTA